MLDLTPKPDLYISHLPLKHKIWLVPLRYLMIGLIALTLIFEIIIYPLGWILSKVKNDEEMMVIAMYPLILLFISEGWFESIAEWLVKRNKI